MPVPHLLRFEACVYTRGRSRKVQLQKKGTRRLIGSRRQPEDTLLIKVWKSFGQFGTPARNILFRSVARTALRKRVLRMTLLEATLMRRVVRSRPYIPASCPRILIDAKVYICEEEIWNRENN